MADSPTLECRNIIDGKKMFVGNKHRKNCRRVIAYDGCFAMHFTSVIEAARQFKRDPSSIAFAAKYAGMYRSAGLYWCYADTPTNECYNIVTGGAANA
jgi:hypothetical protein